MTRIICNILIALGSLLYLGSCANQSYLYMDDPNEMYKRALSFYEQEKWGRASRYFENVARTYLGTAREDSIMFFMARCKFKDEDYQSAITLFESYRFQFSRSDFMEDAEGMLTLSYYYISPGPERDPTNIAYAISGIDEFQSRYPDSKQNEAFSQIREELMGRLYDKSHLNAYTYYKIGQYKSAIVAFRNAIKEHPESPNREKMMYYMNLSGYELARNSIESKEVDRYMALVDMYYSFIAEFPESQYREELDKIVQHARDFLAKKEAETAI